MDAKEQKGTKRCALHIAAYYNSIQALELLLEYKPKIDGKDCNGFTALEFAVMKKNIGIVNLLKAYEAQNHSAVLQNLHKYGYN